MRRPPHRGRAARVRRPDPARSWPAPASGTAADARGVGPPAVAAARRDDLRSGAELAAEFDALRADERRASCAACARATSCGSGDHPRRRSAARRRAPRRVGPPRPQPRPPDAGGQPGARLAPDGQRAPVLPRGPLGRRRALDEGLVQAAVHHLVDAVGDEPADDRADDVDPELVEVAADDARSRSSGPG